MRLSGRDSRGSYKARVRRLAEGILRRQHRPRARWCQDDPEHAPPAFGETDHRSEPERIGVSYVQADSPWAEWIQRLLRRKGYEVQPMPHTTGASSTTSCEIGQEQHTDKVVVVLSHNFLREREGTDPLSSPPPVFRGSPDEDSTEGKFVCVNVEKDELSSFDELHPIHLYGLDDGTVDRLLSAVRSPADRLAWWRRGG
ncbi:TIR domain-containing protein [Nocardiopsis flavescens]